MKTKCLYGHNSELEPFADKSPSEQVAVYTSWGCTAIFGGYENVAFVEAAHAAGMKVFAEFGCFVGKQWWDKVPESRPITATGRPLESEEWYFGVNPSIPGIREMRLKALEETLKQYALDGIWLDFIRWPCHWEVTDPYLPQTSFDAGTLETFCADSGIQLPVTDRASAADLILAQHQPEWAAWRCAQITTWVARAKDILQRTRPDAVLGLFGVPWRTTDHDGAIIDVVGQDYAALAAHVDIFSPMVYHVMCGFPVAWIGDVVEEIKALGGKSVWPIIQSVDEPRPLSADEYGLALELALTHTATDGAVVFTLKGALEKAKLDTTVTHFAREHPVSHRRTSEVQDQ